VILLRPAAVDKESGTYDSDSEKQLASIADLTTGCSVWFQYCGYKLAASVS